MDGSLDDVKSKKSSSADEEKPKRGRQSPPGELNRALMHSLEIREHNRNNLEKLDPLEDDRFLNARNYFKVFFALA